MIKIEDLLNDALEIQGLTKDYANAEINKKFARVTGINCFSDDEINDPKNEEHLVWHIPGGALFIKNAEAEDDGNEGDEQDPETPDTPEEKTPENKVNDALAEGGDVTVEESYSPEAPLNLSKDTNLDLGGNTITTVKDDKTNKYGDGININGTTVTIKGGVIDNTASAPDGAAIMVKAGSNVTLEELEVTSNGFPIYVNGASTVIINSGKYVANNSTAAVFVAKEGAKVIIEDGYFKSEDYNGKNFGLNLKDDLVRDPESDVRNFIEVRGGKFEGFNPAESYGEPNAPVNFVAEGYDVELSNENGKEIYTVVKK